MGIHVGIIMDGNGRWAKQRGWPRIAGHRAGARSVRKVVEAAPDLGVSTLTLYAFSSDNWKRPRPEVSALMQLFSEYLQKEIAELAQEGVKLTIIGRRDRLSRSLLREIELAERATASGQRLSLRVAVDYSSRDAIVHAASLAALRYATDALEDKPIVTLTADDFRRQLAIATCSESAPDLDLLVRTGGERRLSDFLLWEAAYAELVFTERFWPDFEGADLAAAVAEFRSRERRFGGVPEETPVLATADAQPAGRWLE
ncbi:MAG: polyprenyl diphosphate synthase [Terriglobales bacterium]